MDILVTGGAGYLGAHLVKSLLDLGHKVTLLDNFMYGSAGIESFKNHKKLTIIDGDICNIKHVVKAVKNNDVVIALAAIVGDPACELNEEETLNTNYEATKVLVEICNYYKVKRLLFASSCSVYGAKKNSLLKEESPLNPVSLYARTRIMSEDVILNNPNKDLVSTIFRMGTLYGLSDRMRLDLAVNFMTAKSLFDGIFEVFGGDQWRPFVHVHDAARAYIKTLSLDPEVINRKIYNIGFNDQNYKIDEIADCIKSVIPDTNVVRRSDLNDLRDYKVDFEKFTNDFDLKPHYTVESGVKEMKDFINNNNINLNDDIYYNVKYIYREA